MAPFRSGRPVICRAPLSLNDAARAALLAAVAVGFIAAPASADAWTPPTRLAPSPAGASQALTLKGATAVISGPVIGNRWALTSRNPDGTQRRHLVTRTVIGDPRPAGVGGLWLLRTTTPYRPTGSRNLWRGRIGVSRADGGLDHLGEIRAIAARRFFERPMFAADRAGDAVLVWKQARGLRWTLLASSRRSGGGWRRPVMIAAGRSRRAPLRVAIDERGRAVIAYATAAYGRSSRDRTQTRLRLRRIDTRSGRRSRERAIAGATRTVAAISLALNSRGRGVVAWDDRQTSANSDDQGSRVLAATFSAGTLTPRDRAGFAGSAGSAAIDAAGQATVAWTGSTDTEALYLRTTTSGSFGDQHAIGVGRPAVTTSTSGEQTYLALAGPRNTGVVIPSRVAVALSGAALGPLADLPLAGVLAVFTPIEGHLLAVWVQSAVPDAPTGYLAASVR